MQKPEKGASKHDNSEQKKNIWKRIILNVKKHGIDDYGKEN